MGTLLVKLLAIFILVRTANYNANYATYNVNQATHSTGLYGSRLKHSQISQRRHKLKLEKCANSPLWAAFCLRMACVVCGSTQ
jgi:hypothetical protein